MNEQEILLERIALLEHEVELIKERNNKVELDKAWELSSFRVISITVLTYFVALLILLALDVVRPYLNAFIPTAGYYLSTQSLPLIKSWWIRMKI